MAARDWFLIIFTFALGFICGVYLYTNNFQPYYVPDTVPEQVSSDDLSIIAVTYGDGMVGDSFRLEADGNYNYRSARASARATGELPGALLQRVEAAVERADLASFATATTRESCASATGGTDYEYNLEYDATEYTLDTCTTNFSNDTELGTVLLAVWQYLDDPETFSISVSNSPGGLDIPDSEAVESQGSSWSLRGYFERGFRNAGFDSDE